VLGQNRYQVTVNKYTIIIEDFKDECVYTLAFPCGVKLPVLTEM
jgi:hypothetical protein